MREALAGLTVRGRSFVAAGIAAVLCAFLFGQRDLMRIAVLLLALPLVSAFVVARTRYRVACTRRLNPSRTPAGSEARVLLDLANVSRLPTGLMLVEDKIPYALGSRPRFVLDRVEPRGRRQVAYRIRSESRGRYILGPLTIRLTDPFGMCELARAFTHRDTLVVTPKIHPLQPVTLGGEWAGAGDSQSRSVAAAGEDDVAPREYRDGDDRRRIHWRSTAKHGDLMVRREERPWQSRATILLDTRSTGHRGDGPDSSFEWAISAGASIGVHLSKLGYHVRVITDSGAAVSAGRNDSASLDMGDFEGVLLDALAIATTSTNKGFDRVGQALRRTGGEGLIIGVLGTMDLAQAEMLSRMRTGTAVAIAFIIDSMSWLRMPEELRAQHRVTYDKSVAMLRQAGWRAVPVRAGDSIRDLWPQIGRRADDLGAYDGSVSPAPDGDGAAAVNGAVGVTR